MVNISSNANTITDIDGDIHDNAAQIEALNVSLFWFLIKEHLFREILSYCEFT